MKIVYHYSDVIMSAMASQITGVSVVCSTVFSGVDQRKHQSSASLAFVGGFPHKGPVTRKMFPFDDAIVYIYVCASVCVRVCVCVCMCKREINREGVLRKQCSLHAPLYQPISTFMWNYPQVNASKLTDDQSTLVPVIAWCCQATCH